MEKTQAPATTGRFNWDEPQIRVAFLEGEDTPAAYSQLGDVPHGLSYNDSQKLIVGSSNIGVARIDTILRPYGTRVASLPDLSRPEVMEKIRGKHYTDTPALALISEKDEYKRNNSW